MKSIAVGVIVLGNLLGASLAGCILFDDTPANKRACEVFCECTDPGNASCQTDCENDVVTATAGPRCTSCFMKHDNSCAGLEAECTATCAEEGPVSPPVVAGATITAACGVVCACTGKPGDQTCIDDCKASADAQQATAACVSCVASVQVPACNVDSCDSLCDN